MQGRDNMKVTQRHSWELSAQDAVAVQRALAGDVVREGHIGEVGLVAGVDLSPPDDDGRVTGAIVVLSYPELEVVEVGSATAEATFPYVPGLLSFREAPVLLSAAESLTSTPDILLVDGQGLAHPRRMGLACHLGLLLEIPTIGVAKSRLIGRYEMPTRERGAWTELTQDSEVIGAAVRTRDGVNPVFVSIGHKIDLASAIEWSLACGAGYRVPEPTRLAHQAAAGQELRRGRTAVPRRGR